MHKRDYELLAEVVRDYRECFSSNSQHARFASVLGAALEQDNPKFDPDVWMQACMPKAWVGTRREGQWENRTRWLKHAISVRLMRR